MKIKHLILLLCFILSGQLMAQISVTGQVHDAKNEPIIGATVVLKNAQETEGTVTDQDGNFNIELDETGSYTFEIKSLGYKAYSKQYDFNSQKNYSLGKIEVIEGGFELQNVEIIGRTQQDYTSDYSFSATKTAIENKKLPQALTAITKEFIADRQAFQIADAIKTVSSVSNSSFYNHFNIRGISQNESGQILNGMRTRQYYFIQPITSNIERVEVLKGPASVTFSSVDPGGSINMVTKKPLKETRKEVTMGVGSYSTLRGSLDFTGPLDEEKKLLYRINAGVQNAETFRDLVQNNAILVSPSLSYVPNENTAINVEMIYSNSLGNLDRGQPIFGAVAGKTSLDSTPTSLNIGATNDYFQSKQQIITTSLSKKFTDNFSFNGQYMKQTWKEDLQEHRARRFAVDIDNNQIPNLIHLRFSERKQFWDVDNLNTYFNLTVGNDDIKNNILLGYDLHRWHRKNGGGQNSARGFRLKDGTTTRRYNPDNRELYETIEIDGVTLPKPNVPHYDLANPKNSIRDVNGYAKNSIFAIPTNLSTTHSIYIQDQVEFGKFTALLSGRYEWFEDITNFGKANAQNFDNSKFIPRLGLSYEINEKFNAYATYLEGFQPQSNTVDMMPSTVNFFWAPNSPARFDPLISDLKEVGVKSRLLNGDIVMNAAIYEINQKNILIPSEDDPDILVQRGADRSRGFEWDLTGYVLPNFQVNASYAYINSKIVEDANKEIVGQRKENTPEHSANLWTRYDFSNQTELKGLGIGFGAQYSGDKIPWYTRGFTLPSYTLLDAAIYYQPENSKIQLMLKGNNLLNEKHWLGAISYSRLFPGAPRNGLLSMSYKF